MLLRTYFFSDEIGFGTINPAFRICNTLVQVKTCASSICSYFENLSLKYAISEAENYHRRFGGRAK